MADPFVHCSYASGPRKHAIKGALMAKARAILLANGVAEWRAPRAAPSRDKPVIIVTAEFFAEGHSVHRTHSRAARGLRELFHVVGLIDRDQRGPRSDDCFDEIIEFPRGDFIPAVVSTAREIRSRAPDIVLHLGVGLSPLVVALASLRLAPIQCASFGHTATTMSPAIDCFILPADFVGAEDAFSERIVGLPARAFPYEARREPLPARVDHGGVRIAIAASLPKLGPAFFATLGEIARRAARPVEFEFFTLGAAGLARLELIRVLRALLPGALVHPELEHAAYLAAMSRCDFFLCPFPYGNMNSIIDAVGVGLPGVCHDGDEPHARADAAIFARLGLPGECIAATQDAYVAAALRLVDDPDVLADARRTAAGIDLKARFFDGDDGLLGRALLDLVAGSI